MDAVSSFSERTRKSGKVESLLRARLKRALRDRSGDTLIEMAIALPTFFMLLFGICAFAMVLTSWCSATYAIRAGARYASMHSSSSVAPASSTMVQSYVQSQLFMPGATASSVTVTYFQYVAAPGNYVGNAVEVSIAWNQAVKVPYYSKVLSLQSVAFRLISR